METYKRNIKTTQRLEYGLYQFLDHFLGRRRVYKVIGGRRRAFHINLEKTLKKSGEGKTIPIERRANLSLEDFKKNYLKKGIPVILEGAAKDWECTKNWSLEYFKALHGKDEVALDSENNRKITGVTTLADIIENIRNGGKQYYRFYPLLKRHPEHLIDFDYKWLRERKHAYALLEKFVVAIGGKDTYSSLHNENPGNLFVQTYGEKKWIIYPPYYTPVMDPGPVYNTYRSARLKTEKGEFDPFNPKYEAPFEIYKYIDHYETILKPGDILSVPAFYWHTVVNLSDSIGVGYRWLNPFAPFKIAPLYMFLDFFSTKPFIWKEGAGYDRAIDQKKQPKQVLKQSEASSAIPSMKVG